MEIETDSITLGINVTNIVTTIMRAVTTIVTWSAQNPTRLFEKGLNPIEVGMVSGHKTFLCQEHLVWSKSYITILVYLTLSK